MGTPRSVLERSLSSHRIIPFAEAVEGMGCYAERVEDISDVSSAVERCLSAVESGTMALLEATIDRRHPSGDSH